MEVRLYNVVLACDSGIKLKLKWSLSYKDSKMLSSLYSSFVWLHC